MRINSPLYSSFHTFQTKLVSPELGNSRKIALRIRERLKNEARAAKKVDFIVRISHFLSILPQMMTHFSLKIPK
jgi:hypothetical protein